MASRDRKEKRQQAPELPSVDEFGEELTRTAVKREAQAVTELGLQLTELSKDHLASIPLGDETLEAINTYRRISSRNAQRRQISFIGKLLWRNEDVDAIAAAYDKTRPNSETAKARTQQLEKLRERLVKGEQVEIEAAISKHETLDRQMLRSLVRQAKKEQAKLDDDAPIATPAGKKLYRYLSDTCQ